MELLSFIFNLFIMFLFLVFVGYSIFYLYKKFNHLDKSNDKDIIKVMYTKKIDLLCSLHIIKILDKYYLINNKGGIKEIEIKEDIYELSNQPLIFQKMIAEEFKKELDKGEHNEEI